MYGFREESEENIPKPSLTCKSTPPHFYAIYTMRNKYCDLCVISQRFQNGTNLNKKKNAPRRQNSSLLELIPIEKGGINENG